MQMVCVMLHVCWILSTSSWDSTATVGMCDVALRWTNKCVGLLKEVRSINLKSPSIGDLYWQHLATTNLPWQNFLSPGFATKSWREIPSFLELPKNFLITRSRISGRKPPCQKSAQPLNPLSCFSRTLSCDRHTWTDRHGAISYTTQA